MMNRPPTPREVWIQCHAEYSFRLGVMPCHLRFSEEVKTAEHRFKEMGGCVITINPTLEFERPEHLLLHEFAHCRVVGRNIGPDPDFGDMVLLKDGSECCVYGGHCEHWAQELVSMYRETATSLPYCTMFESFAEAASIKYKIFERFNNKTWSR